MAAPDTRIIESLVSIAARCLRRVLRKFRAIDVLKKEDIREDDLLHHYRVGILMLQGRKDLTTLRIGEDYPPNENILLQRKVGGDVGFPMVLQAGLRHFFKQLGFMFHQGFINGETAFSAALLLFQ